MKNCVSGPISSAAHYIDTPIGALNIWITGCTEEWRNVVQLVEALRFKPEDHGFDSRWCHWYFSLTYSFWPYNGPGFDSTCNMNIYWEVKLCRTDKLSTFICRLSSGLRSSTSWKPQGLFRPVQELLYLFLHPLGFSKNFAIGLVHFLTCNGPNCRAIYFSVLSTFSPVHIPKSIV